MGVTLRALRARLSLALALAMISTTGAQTAVAGAMSVGKQTSQPIGHYDFCKRKPDECAIRPGDQRALDVTNEIWAKISRVNRSVNAQVKPMSDMAIYGQEEYWAYPDHGVGDCEDYALEKRRELARSGISLANLLLTVVRKSDGEGHAVLTVRTDRGDFILDNLTNEIHHWHDTNYRYLKRQASYHTGRWVSILDDQNMLVGAVK